MMFWIALLVMLAGAALCVLLPLSRVDASGHQTDGTQVYREQLRSIDLSLKEDGADVEALTAERAEVARRILKEVRQSGEHNPRPQSNRVFVIVASLVGLLVVPAISIGGYLSLGAFGMPDIPLSQQKSAKVEKQSIEQLVQTAENHLEKNPNDVKGWRVLANVYRSMARHGDRAQAIRQLIRLEGRQTELLADLGEAITASSGNVISGDAKLLFTEALRRDKNNTKSGYFLALSFEQEGRNAEALQAWKQLRQLQPANAQWQKTIAAHIEKSELALANVPGPSRDDVEAAATLSTDERSDMINSMVSRLADRLKESPNDIDGWVRLINAYNVLGDQKSLQSAFATARSTFSNNEAYLLKLDQLAAQINLSQKDN